MVTGTNLPGTTNFIGRNARLENEGYRADGSYIYGRLLRNAETADEYEFGGTIRRINKGKGRFATATEINPSAIQQIADFLENCRELDIHVVGFIPPYAGKVYDRLKQDSENYPHVFELYESLKPIFDAEDRLLMDFSDIRSLGSNDFETTDGFHGSEVSYLKLLRELSNRDKILASSVNVSALNDGIAHTFSARQIIEERPEAQPRSPQSSTSRIQSIE